MNQIYSKVVSQNKVSFRLCLAITIGLAAGFWFAPIESAHGAIAIQGSSSKDTPDPYFNQPIKPRNWSNSPSTKNAAPISSTDFQLAPSNQPVIPKSTGNASNALGGFVADKKPKKGPMIMPPLRQTGWVAPNTRRQIAAVNHESRTLNTNLSASSIGTAGPAVDSIIRERPEASAGKSFTATPVDSNSFTPMASNTNSQNDFKATPNLLSPIENDNSFSANGFNAKSSSGFESKPTNSFSTNLSAGSGFSAAPKEQSGSTTRVVPPQTGSTTRAAMPKQISQKGQTFEPSKVLAIVGGEPIFVGDMMFEINQLIEKFLPTAPEEVKERERKKLIPRVLPKFVDSKLLFHGMLSELPDEVDIDNVLTQAESEFDTKALDAMIKNSGLKSSSEFDAHLRAQGSSLRNMRKSWARDQLTKYFLGQQLQINSEVTHQQMLAEYRKNFDTYEIKAKARWEQLMVRFDRSDSPAAAKKQIAALGDQVVYGANFQAVAKKDSHGFMASKGGQQDWTSRGALVLKEIDDAIFTLPIGELSDIIETPDGYHIIRVLERTEDNHTPFLEAQVEIKKRILDEKRKAAFDDHIAKLRKEIPVQYPFEADAILDESKNGGQLR